MQLAEIVYKKLQSLPESAQKEVLDYVEYLEQKSRRDDNQWAQNSLRAALRGIETDNWPEFGPDDIKERWQ